MDPPFPPPETAPPAPPVDPDQEFSTSPETAEKFSLTAMMEGGGGYVEQENGHSMPNLEEARTEGAIASGGSYRKGGLLGGFGQARRRFLLLVAVAVGAFVLIVAFSVAIASNRTSLSASGTGGPVSGVSRLREVQKFLAVRISDQALLEELDTPQNKAALWIADQDELQVPLPSDPANYDTSFEFVQRYIMAVFYFALDGPNWTKQIDFLSSKDVCDWNQRLDQSVTSEYEHADNWDYGVRCTDGVITHIFISANKLAGELPSEMGDLLDLKHLSLFKNKITGKLHSQLEYLEKLAFLALEMNDITGPIPSWIGSLTSLKYLGLGDNQLTGTLPDGMANLINLEELALDDNELSGSIHNLETLTKMRKLYLSNNKFNGRIHDATFSTYTGLEIVDLSRNLFIGYFPVHFYNIEQVDMHSNRLNEDSLPEVTSANLNSPMTFLSLYDNGISGPMPKSLGFLSALEYLDLSENSFTGDISDTFDNMGNLKSLYLSMNPYLTEGSIPELRDCRKLEALSMTETKRTGYLHNWLGSSFPNLMLLDLHNNDLTGQIPTSFGDLSNIKLLFLNHNSLTGAVPTELANLSNLVSFFVHNNELTGTFQPLCDAKPDHLAFFVSDCKTEVDCDCCSTCCVSGDSTCSNTDENMDTLNEKVSRDAYLFSEETIFDSKSPP